MNKTLLSIGLAVSLLAGAAAHADPRYYAPTYPGGLYFGMSAGELIYKEDGLDTMRPGFAEFRIGQEINPYLAIEGRVGGGLGRDDVNGFSTNVDLMYGAYAKGILPLSPFVSAYGLAGVGGVQLHHNYPDFNHNDAGFSYGLGAEFKVARGTGLTLEWLRVTDGSNQGFYYTADQVAVGVNWRF
ncbi:MAG TPA: porin family protein [Steroidobacteraceae bacterium]|nr:porin family protein [Steroidobacteraceae bacterium]